MAEGNELAAAASDDPDGCTLSRVTPPGDQTGCRAMASKDRHG